ncbi:MAG: phosphatase PAP2 family protein [Actinomycetota bacterium]
MPDAPALRLPPWVDEIDEAVDAWWDRFRNDPALDRLFYAASAAGDFSAVWHAYNLGRLATGAIDPRRAARFALAIGAESLIVNQGLKRLFRRERPEHEVERPLHLRTPSTSSFPSGHASAAAMAVTLLNERSRLRLVHAALGGVVASSRIHVRIHHASDILVGLAVGRVLAKAWQRAWPAG